MAKYAVIVVDMLNDFVTGALACDRGKAIVPAVAKLCEAARVLNSHKNFKNLPTAFVGRFFLRVCRISRDYTGSAMNFFVTLKISKSCLSRLSLRASRSTPS